MTLLFPVLLLVAGLLCSPAFVVSRRRSSESWWLLFLAVPALAVWLGLTAVGYGAQSLSNIIEVFWLVVASILFCYVKVLVIDRLVHRPHATTYVLMALLVVGAVLLRTFMPVLPE